MSILMALLKGLHWKGYTNLGRNVVQKQPHIVQMVAIPGPFVRHGLPPAPGQISIRC